MRPAVGAGGRYPVIARFRQSLYRPIPWQQPADRRMRRGFRSPACKVGWILASGVCSCRLRSHFKIISRNQQAGKKVCARREAGAFAGFSPDAPCLNRARAKRDAKRSGLTFASHAIVPSHDDVRGPIPDDFRTTIHGRATHDGHPSRHRMSSTLGKPRPIPDDDGRPSLDGCHATNGRRAIRDDRPNHRNGPHAQPPAPRRIAQSAPQR